MWLMECKPWFAGKQGKPWTPEPQNGAIYQHDVSKVSK